MNKHLHVSGISFPSDLSIPQLLKRITKQNPDKTALIFKDQSMSFKELETASDQLAQYLINSEIQPEDFVALYMERSLEIIVGIFGILKAGGAYVPIDVDYPKERMAFMVEDSKAKIILTQKHLTSNLPTSTASIICLDQPLPKTDNNPGTENNNPASEQLAYMIYTSGSTGKPKGVMITHENVCHQLEGQQAIAPEPIGAMMLTCSISFDVSVLTIFWSLLQGATLVLPEQGEEKDMRKLSATIYRNKVTHILTLPSLYTLLLEQGAREQLQSLQLVNVSGEVCPVSLAQMHEQVVPNGQLYNLYGPTEATVNCTYFKFPKGYAAPKAPIGIPIKNYKIFILDKHFKKVPKGEVGEIYIGGTRSVVGRGYWDRIELSAKRFIINNEFEVTDSLLYKTGDLGRWMPDGNIEFLGRTDFQVKYRGFRIELGEVETAISNHPAVKEIVVVLRNEHEINNQQLVAYLTVKQELEIKVSELRDFLSGSLPEYMLPSHFVFLDKMPLTTNGKFDRNALPEPSAERPALSDAYVPPVSDLEKRITEKWEMILGISPIGRNDKFFELGGTSITAAKFIGEMMKELDTSIFITSIFDYPTVASYANFLEKNYKEKMAELSSKIDKLESHEQPEGDQCSRLILTDSDINKFADFIPFHLDESVINSSKPDSTTSPIFILAPPRSGTTLLRVMLAGHPDLFACNELQLLHFQSLAEREKAFSGKFNLWKEGLIRAVMELKNCTGEEAIEIIKTLEIDGVTTQEIYHHLREWSGGKIVVDKSPSYLLDPLALKKAIHEFPNAKFIHLVRHPYSMVTSFEKYHIDQALYLKNHDYTARQLGELVWLESHKNALNFLEEVPEKQQFTLKYEDLVLHPEIAMQELCYQIGLPFNPDLLNPYKNLNKKMTDGIYSSSRSMGDTHFDEKNKIDPNKAEEWKGIFSDNFLCSATKIQAKEFGYEVEATITNLSEQESITKTEEPTTKYEKPASKNRSIAIIGMACRFPGTNTLDEFWENLVNAIDISKSTSEKEIEEEGLSPDGNFIRKSYSLDHPYAFDAGFFGMLPKEATMLDPQHRVFLETAYHALESAGYDPYSYSGKIGLFGGVAKNAYFTGNILTNPELIKEAGGYKEMLASESSFSITRIAYKLNLKGPAVNVQTACSTGGVAVHLGSQSILSGDSDIVLVGGGRIQPSINVGYEYVEGGPLSADGTCRAFDAQANGMVQGNGVGMLVLKDLDKAIEDGDHVWAVIKGTAINNDGADKTGITAPSSKGQADCIAAAIEKAGLNGNQISYFETHGTGTFIGDPIEIQGLTDAVKRTSKNAANIPIGSVKTNLGHLDAGACIAGIIKTALSLHHGMLPPTMHFQTPNPQLGIEKTPFYINKELQPWLTSKEPRRAGISSFGLGGTNAHIILEEAPEQSQIVDVDNDVPQLMLVSAKSEEVVIKFTDSLIELLKKSDQLSASDIANTLLTRPQFDYRKAFIWEKDKAQQLKIGQAKNLHKFAFMFPGGGAQYEGMAEDLYQKNPFFKGEVDRCFEILLHKHGLDIKRAVYPNGVPQSSSEKLITQPSFALPALFTIEYALARLWQHWGIQPDVMIGHSMGEYTAACIAGVMDLEDALGLVAVRGKLFDSLEVNGGMLSIAATKEQIKPFLNAQYTISVINKKDSIVVSSTNDAIDALQTTLENNGIECSKIHIAVPAHSPLIDPILDDFKKYLQTVDLQSPKIPFVSNVTGTWITEEQAIDPEYWISHLRQTVEFAKGLETLINGKLKTPDQPATTNRIFLEVGPGQTLSTFARAVPTAAGESRQVLASVRHPKEVSNDLVFILKTIGRLWTEGAAINWKNLLGDKKFRRVPLPNYPFQRTKYFQLPGKTSHNVLSQSVAFPTSQSHQIAEQTQSPNMESISRIPILIEEIKKSLHELSGIETADMDETATFLELGFDSLFLSQAVIKFNYKFKLKLSFRMLFEEAPTISALAELVDKEIPAEQFKPQKQVETIIEQPNLQMQNLPEVSIAGNTQIEKLIQQQLTLMQQQLNLLNGNGTKQDSQLLPALNKVKTVDVTGSKTVDQVVNQEVEIKRNAKGVTAKMGNYKKIGVDNELTPDQQKSLAEFMASYNAKTQKSKALSQTHRQYYADPRSVTGFSKLWKEICYQIAHEKSKGSKIWDVDGNEYIDYVMSYGVALFGHMPDFVEEAVIAAIGKGNSIDLLPPEATEIARIICKLTGYDRVTLANTGTEAVLGAVRAARTATGRDRIAVFDTDYHGMIDQFMVRGINMKGKNKTLPGSPGIPKFMVENTLTLDYDDPEILQKLDNEISELAAVVIEPVQAQNPHWQHSDLMQQIRQLTEKHGVALIFDEIINGFRMHQRGAQGWYGVEADISAYGKSISGGLPLAAVAGKAKYMDAFDGGIWNYGDDSSPDGVISYFASTFIKNPISVAAGYAAIKEIERLGPDLQDDLNQKTIQFAERVREIFLRTKAPFMIQSASSFFMLKYVDGSPLNRLFNYYLRMHGVNVRERPCFISTAHTEADFEKTFIGFERAIADMFEDGLIEPYEGEDLNVIVYPVSTKTKRSSNQIDYPITVPLTEGQQEIFLSNQIAEGASKAYNVATQIKLEGDFDCEKMEACLIALTDRHEALRTVFDKEGKTQTVLPKIEIQAPFIDLTQTQESLAKLHAEEAEHLFDLEQGPLVRFKIIKVEEQVHYVFINVHHIICDGWSLGILTRELGALYGGENLTETKSLSEFAKEQTALRNSEIHLENEAYWLGEYSESVPVMELPTDFQRPPIRTYAGAIEKITFEPAFASKIRTAAAKQGATFYVYMLAAYQAFLTRLTGQNNLVLGIAAAGHNLQGNQNLVGHAISLLPVRTKSDLKTGFNAYLKTVRSKVLDAFDHQQFTYGSLVKKLSIGRSADRNTLVNVAFNFDSPLDNLFFGNLQASTTAIRRHYETFDAFINLKPIGDRVDFEWNFNADIFRNETIKLRLEEFKIFLQALLEDAERPITELRLLPDFESEQLLTFGSGAKMDFPLHQCLHEYLQEQAQKTPSSIAIETTLGEKLSYQQLDEKSTQFAKQLMQEGVTSGEFVGLCVERSLDMLIGIYGILKAGAAYVPIDPRNPVDRIRFILEDAGCKFMVIQSRVAEDLPKLTTPLVLLDNNLGSTLNSTTILPQTGATQAAYMIYTSGSTGQPKGVVVRHENAVNTLFAINEYWQMKEGDQVYSVSSMSFDMSIPDYFLTIMMGGKLVLADEATKKDGFALKESIEKYQPEFMQATPSTWKILMLSEWKGSSKLTAIAGGEGFPKKLAAEMATICKAVWNGYGPTETTIYATYQKVSIEHIEACPGEFVAIGSPVANTKALILDKNENQVPVGVPGEMYIGGRGVSSGYLKRPALNKEKFVSIDGNSYYRTGDLVRHLPTGEIEFLGRIDNQVKIRGYRIEIGEIEECIKKHTSVANCAVNIFEDKTGSSQLAAYIVWEQTADLEGVKTYLKQVLPGYMVPVFFVEMEELPLNTSLKIDRKALPEPAFNSTIKEEFEEPTTKGEELLTGLWKELLGVPQVSIQDDFFELGGHSLAAVQLMSRIKEATGKKLPLTTLFQNSTVKKLAVQLNGFNTPTKNGISKNGKHESIFSSLICIKKGGKKPPLYLIHGGGLHVLFYQNLVKHLDNDQPIYALQAKGLNPGEEPLDTIEDMAAHYIQEIKLQNPNGPYCLAGYSLGGLIAWEMAAQLKQDGNEVPLIALFDAVAKYEWAGEGSTGNMKKKLKKLGFNLSLLVKEPGKAIEYKSSVLKMQLQHMKGKLTMAYRNNSTNEIEEGYLPYGKEVYEKSLQAYDRYELKPLDIHVDLFRANEQMFYLHDPDLYGWDQFANKGVTVHEIEGNHLTLFDEPHGKQVADALGKRLDEIAFNKQTKTTKQLIA